MKLGHFAQLPESALGAGGRAFKSPRPDQSFQSDRGRNQAARISTV